ncbi:helix-turn-helix domain-containing protein [uncultured Bacteroides sp.]|uniref:helix-turn-helix domain-containing protein n=1 Tax=uncultured Bacteroides sp. TaxID=162156 RepID=UPI00262E7A99|nr:helix-turn-helix domain-containing protein [uncultured Bacteroides sp.]
MEENKRQVKGIWIPIDIWKDDNLNWNEKILFIEIDSYTTNDKDCYISNEYISKLLGISETSANKVLSSLIKKGYVIKTLFDGRRRFVKSALSISINQGCAKEQGRVVPNDNILYTYTNKDNIKEDIDKSISKKDEIDYDYIKQQWEEICCMLATIRELNPKRKKAIANTLKNNNANVEDLIKCFKIIASSEFCKGDNKQGWKATFDWIINDTKSCFNRLLEGEFSKNMYERKLYEAIINNVTDGNVDESKKKVVINGQIYK